MALIWGGAMEAVSWGDDLAMETGLRVALMRWGAGRGRGGRRWALWELRRRRGYEVWASRGTNSTLGCMGSKDGGGTQRTLRSEAFESCHPHPCPLHCGPCLFPSRPVQAGAGDLVYSPVHSLASPLQCERCAWYTVVLNACLLQMGARAGAQCRSWLCGLPFCR